MIRSEEVKLKVGIELHHQLLTKRKLFCSCPVRKTDYFPNQITRRLRPTQSELGEIDPAAVFEFLKGKKNVYFWSQESSCFVELDEEPPHSINQEALDTAILISLTLNAKLVDEVHVMRKIVIDGSNTSGFQRTAVIATDGFIQTEIGRVGVQSVTLEEDAARIIREDNSARYFALDRLGVPLIEISLEPVTGTPEQVMEVALTLGRILRSTRRVARGLGTIRQDLNISIMDGPVIEVKGVQKLELIEKIIDYELRRQYGLLKIAERIKERGLNEVQTELREIKEEVKILKAERGTRLYCIKVKNFAGILGYEPFEGIRLGKEIAEVARANNVGGIIHSDEFEKLGLDSDKVSRLYLEMNASRQDALILISCSKEKIERVSKEIIQRIRYSTKGVPAETRAPTELGETRYMRPRPGAERMYPETDIPEIVISEQKVKELSALVPEDWRQTVERLVKNFGLKKESAVSLLDEEKVELFMKIMQSTELEAPYVCSVLIDLPRYLSRIGVDEARLGDELFLELMALVSKGKLAKEAVQEVLEAIGKGHAENVNDAVKKLGLEQISSEELELIIQEKVNKNRELIRLKGKDSFSAIMGQVMKEVRGRVSGEVVARILNEKIQEAISRDAR